MSGITGIDGDSNVGPEMSGAPGWGMPFGALLIALRSVGISVGPREVEAIRRLLATDHDWNSQQLKVALRSILTSDDDERTQFDRIFQETFRDWVHSENAKAAADSASTTRIDVNTLVAYLKEALPPKVVPPEPGLIDPKRSRTVDPDPYYRSPVHSWHSRSVVAIALLGLMISLLLVERFSTWQGAYSGSSKDLSVSTQSIDFQQVPSNVIRYEAVTITNRGQKKVRISRIEAVNDEVTDSVDGKGSVDGSGSVEVRDNSVKSTGSATALPAGALDDFALLNGRLDESLVLEPGQSHRVDLHFARRNPGAASGKLLIHTSSAEPPLTIALKGERTVPPTELDLSFQKPENFGDPIVEVPTQAEDDPAAPLAIQIESQERPQPWKYFLATGGFLLVLTFFWGRWMLFQTSPPGETSIAWRENEDGEMFSFRDLGVPPEPLLTVKDARVFGNLLGFVPAEDSSKQLNTEASIQRTIKSGVPQIVYKNQIVTREVILLEDLRTHPDYRTSIAEELCALKLQTGVRATHGVFQNRIDQFWTSQGSLVRLNELSHDPDAYVFLVFTDGTSFLEQRTRSADQSKGVANFGLDELRRFPHVAWIDFREPRQRNSGLSMPAQFRIPVFDATRDGIATALRTLRTARGRRRAEPEVRPMAPVRRFGKSSESGVNLESLLGDALIWAADCAWIQPCSDAMAQQLRKQFHPHLSPTMIQRLYRTPGTRRDVAGFTFDTTTLAVLREIWLNRRPAEETATPVELIDLLRNSQWKAVAAIIVERARQKITSILVRCRRWGSQVQGVWQTAHHWLSTVIGNGFSNSVAPQVRNTPQHPNETPPRSAPQPRSEPATIESVPSSRGLATQEAVLKFLLDQINASRPEGNSSTRSRAELSWEAVHEWIQLSLDRTNDLSRLSAISKSTAGGWLQQQLSYLSVDGDQPSRPVQLRFAPTNLAARWRLNQLDPEIGVRPLIPKPSTRQWLFLGGGVLLTCLLLLMAATSDRFFPSPPLWQVKGPGVNRLFLLERHPGNVNFTEIRKWGAGWTPNSPPRRSNYEYSVGVKSPSLTQNVRLPATDSTSQRSVVITTSMQGNAQLRMQPIAPGRLPRRSQTVQSADQAKVLDRTSARFDAFQPTYLLTAGTNPDAATASLFEDDKPKGGSQKGSTVEDTEQKLDPGKNPDETPTPQIRSDEIVVTAGFLMAETEVTQKLFQDVMGYNPSFHSGAGWNAPVENVSLKEAQDFCVKFTEIEKKAGRLPEDWQYALPTEAQWELACRANTTTRWSFGDTPSRLTDFAWYDAAVNRPQPVATKTANPLGLHDVYGNVWEWCLRTDTAAVISGSTVDDESDAQQNPIDSKSDPKQFGDGKGPSNTKGPPDQSAVICGGSFLEPAEKCHSESKEVRDPETRDKAIGFRMVAVRKSGKPAIAEPRRQAIEMVWIPPGKFMMGSPETEPNRDDDETLHPVELTQGFYLGRFEITQGQYESVMGTNPSRFTETGWNGPVERVSWEDAQEFCKKLTEQELAAGRLPTGWVYTLPTEAQWEYACRAGTQTAYHFGDEAELLEKYDWFDANSDNRTHSVGQKLSNGFGLYDMHGNVCERCQDYLGHYGKGIAIDPSGPLEGSARVFRGGSWYDTAQSCRSAGRGGNDPSYSFSALGFRVSAVQPKASDRELNERAEGTKASE